MKRARQTTNRYAIGLTSCSLLAACAIAGCLDTGAAESGAEDEATETDKAALGFGIEADAPDGLAVLEMANTYSKTKLRQVGLTSTVAAAIVKARTNDGPFADLIALDKVKGVGPKVFGAMRWYATINDLYPTSLRIPLVADYGDGALLGEINDALVAAGQAALPDHIWISAEATYSDFMDSYRARVAAAGLTDYPDPVAYGTIAGINELAVAGDHPVVCWVGDAWDVFELVTGEADALVSDQYVGWAWRVGKKAAYQDEDTRAALATDEAWGAYDTQSNEVWLAFSTNDGGDNVNIDAVTACRDPR